jgi:undecaprenyl-diphosphatase
VVIAVAVLAVLAWLAATGAADAHDRALLLALRDRTDPSDPLGPAWLEETMRDFTALGGVGVLLLLTLGATVYLLLLRKPHMAALMIAAVAGGAVASLLLKLAFDRPRPDLVPHGSYVYTASFPSGHAMMSAVTYLTLGALVASVRPQRGVKAFLILSSVLLTVLVGVSRVYLGVHWPSDVLGGWAAGAAWAAVAWAGAHRLQRHGRVERDTDDVASG